MNNPSKYRILISVEEGNTKEILSRYESEEFKHLDAFELKKLLENTCNRIILNYKRDLRAREAVRESFQRIKLTRAKLAITR